MYVLHFGDIAPYLPVLAHALVLTIELTAMATLGSLGLSYVLAFVLGGANRWLRLTIEWYVQIIRNTPVLIQMFLIYFGLPLAGVRLDPFTAGVIALIVNNTAYITEILRGGIQSIPRGQIDAARISGLGRGRIYLSIVLPQASRKTYSAVTNQLIILFLNTSVCSYVALNELTATAMSVASDTYRMFEVYLLIAAVYVVLTFVLGGLFRLVERLRLNWETQ
ncbi:amino acid ABC transporter permease [Paraburkholderia sp. BCC1886]|uniref:amino acid ABC transporter permease n=1 Tax=Paraburkholderia sp. BCC1886 TaxID=2562670 RepID=UPI0011839C58|nr:amino acid ABC transporter permease [Paraburkholderia sp. BCC1886]